MNIDIINYSPMLCRSSYLTERLARCFSDYVVIYIAPDVAPLTHDVIARMVVVAHDSGASLVYGDYYATDGNRTEPRRTINYQIGSVRNDFDFGGVWLVRRMPINLAESDYGALYDLRLQLSARGAVVRIPEFLSTITINDNRSSGEKQFDYVNPNSRAVQKDYEHIFTQHLKRIGACLSGEAAEVDACVDDFAVTASVIIPVRNRERTIADAIQSALMQQTDFRYNVIVIDNHSTDRTTEIVRSMALTEPRIVHLIPEREDLGIGGCWMYGVNNSACGAFAVQLDSDDLYQAPDTLQLIIDKFRSEHCAMVIGSYTLTDINCNTIAPGLIDHSEWTDDNGRNNALRINGLGAPRAFVTQLLRRLPLPNTSYGEDYAVALRMCREYRIGRIFKSLYLCRRWNDNSDANLDHEKVNRNNAYKDFIRSVEITARRKKLE
ncbi:MAG TPA: glycosyl transferase [Bacteroidales bacterium]|nr:glycosyl transferase [Bacteroidales bacterium]